MSIIGTALSGTIAAQTALQTISNNIANMATEGYTRQDVNLTSQYQDGQLAGSGVAVKEITRVDSSFIDGEIRRNVSQLNQAEAQASAINQLDIYLSNDDSSIEDGISSFFRAVDEINALPTDSNTRNQGILVANDLVSRFHSLETRAENIRSNINTDIENIVNVAGTLLTQISDINASIEANIGRTSSTPSDLIDQQNRAAKSLSEIIGINVQTDSNNVMSITLEGGFLLVDSQSVVGSLTTQNSSDGSGNTSVNVDTGGGKIDITNLIKGGKLAGFIAARDDVSQTLQRDVGRIAMALSDNINTQQKLGMDSSGQLGANLFTDINDTNLIGQRVRGDSNNNSGTDVQYNLTVNDTGVLTNSNYSLSYSSSTYTLTRLSDNTVVHSGSGLPTNTDGFSISLGSGSTINDGDVFHVNPTEGYLNAISVIPDNGSKFAVGWPINASAQTSNIGTGAVEVTEMLSVTDINSGSNLGPNMFVIFDSSTSYRIFAEGDDPSVATPRVSSTTLPSSGIIDVVNGSPAATTIGRIKITGTPQAADRFTLTYNSGATGDNRNGLKMSAIGQAAIIENNSLTLSAAYNNAAADVGVAAQSANNEASVSRTLLGVAEQERSQTSGVNLDEELVQMIQFQQLFSASARLSSVTRQIFQELIQATG